MWQQQLPRQWQKYLWAAVDGLPSVYYDVAQGVVAIQLDCVKLSQFDRIGVAYGGHAGAHVKPDATWTDYYQQDHHAVLSVNQENF